MNDTPNFTSILDRPSSEVERPKPLPVGTYLVAVAGIPRLDKSSKKGTEFVEFTYNLLQVVEADEEELEAYGGIADKTIKDTYYITEASGFRLKDTLNNMGAGDDSMTMRARLEETPGCQLVISVIHEASQDGQSMFARIKNTAAAE